MTTTLVRAPNAWLDQKVTLHLDQRRLGLGLLLLVSAI
jgi:hypothetical protein